MKKSTKGLFGFIAGAIAGVAAYKIIKDKKANQEDVIVDCDDFGECDCECDCTCDEECECTCDNECECTCEEKAEEACECPAEEVSEEAVDAE